MFSFHREQDTREYILIGDRRDMDYLLEFPDNKITEQLSRKGDCKISSLNMIKIGFSDP